MARRESVQTVVEQKPYPRGSPDWCNQAGYASPVREIRRAKTIMAACWSVEICDLNGTQNRVSMIEADRGCNPLVSK